MMKILCLTIGLVLVAVSAAAQTTPPSSTNRMLTSNNAWLNVNSEPPCAPSTTTGTITLALGSPCANPVYPWLGGSPDNWQFTLTGNGTLATTGPYNPGHVFGIQVTEGPSTAFTLATPTSGWSVQGLCTAAATPSASCGGANGLALSGVASGKNIITCKVIDTTPTIWCGPVLAGLTTATVPSTPPQYVTGSIGAFVSSGTTATVTLAAAAGQSVLCLVDWSPQSTVSLNSVFDGTSNLTLGDGGTGGSIKGQVAYEINISGHSVSTLTANFSGSVTGGGQIVCDTISGATTIVSGGHALNVQSNIGSGTNAVTSGTITSAVNALVWGASSSSTGTVTLTAGTGFTQREQSSAGFNFVTETKVSSGLSDSAQFTNSSATNTNNFTGALIVQ